MERINQSFFFFGVDIVQENFLWDYKEIKSVNDSNEKRDRTFHRKENTEL